MQMGSNGKCLPGYPNLFMCAPGSCKDTLNGGVVLGQCIHPLVCKGLSYSSGLFGSGQTPGDFGNIGSIFQLLGGLMQGGGGSGGGGSSGGTTGSTGAGGCTSYYPVTSPSTDPCAYYTGPSTGSSLLSNTPGLTTTSSNVSDALNQALGGSSNSTSNSLLSSSAGSDTGVTSDTLLNQLNQGTTGGASLETQTNTSANTGNATAPTSTSSQQAMLSGTKGNIVLTKVGGTVVANSVDTTSNTAVAGFYGGDTFSGTPTGFIAGMCQSRPWAGSFVSFVIPPSFFDSLCALGGYQVGTPPPSVSTVGYTPSKQATTTQYAPPVVLTAKPQVSIWASPPTVSLGSRTSIFWNSQGVTSCIVTSPDGSFNQTTLYGGASTVPITDATVFTISCVAPDGSHITDNTTVNLAI